MPTLFLILILVMSVVIHEVSHGYAAAALGDPTARLAGRLTLNPLKHLDPIGSVILPGLLILLGGFVVGWAKPVPYNPYNLRGGKWGPALVAVAGPISNILLAVIFGLVSRAMLATGAVGLPAGQAGPGLVLVQLVVVINVMLAMFNLIPVPPLDGSKILFALIPPRWSRVEELLTRWQLAFIVLLLLFLANSRALDGAIFNLLHLFAGSPVI
jgi:Zn-dependent protease